MLTLFTFLDFSILLLSLSHVQRTYSSSLSCYEGSNECKAPESHCVGDGHGWSCDYKSDFSHVNGDHKYCEIDTIPWDYPEELFIKNYLFKKPVLIDAKYAWTNKSFWSKKNLVHAIGDFPFESGRSLELVINSGIGQVNVTLREYLNDSMRLDLENDLGPYDAERKEPIYIFDRSIWREQDEFQTKYFRPPSYLPNGDVEYGILFIGVTGTGATWHAHGETWAGISYGRKRWFVYPPEITPVGGFWPGYSTLDWFKNIYPHLKDKPFVANSTHTWNDRKPIPRKDVFSRVNANGTRYQLDSDSSIFDILSTDHPEMNARRDLGEMYKPVECIQGEGQLIYLPEFWWHAVLNLGDVVAGGIQTSSAYTLWMDEIDRLGHMEKEVTDEKMVKAHRPLLSDLEKEQKHWEMMELHRRLYVAAPNNAVHPFFIGFEYKEMHKMELAIKYLSEAIRMDPSFIEAYVSLANVLGQSTMLLDRYKAEKLLRIAYALNKNHPNVRKELMEMFERMGREDLKQMVVRYEDLPNIVGWDEIVELTSLEGKRAEDNIDDEGKRVFLERSEINDTDTQANRRYNSKYEN